MPLFFLLKAFAPTSIAAFLMVLVMLPWFLFAMYEKNGQPLEKFLKQVYYTKFKRPKIRTYQTENLYVIAGRQNQLNREVQGIVTGKKARRG